MKLIYESYYQNLGQNIAFYRNRRKLTQLKLSELVEISRNHLSRIENADCAVSLDTVFAIAGALGVEPYKLFQDKE
ncbi:MAG: helix-turn-helix domain-containing protein [Oscillospiraceae bacterium]|jgi:transcriptional regulator with XRE-family HTH domain|nr:helix-turn-helix domain-containing protein [Oscillospiraceae bacterium]